MLVTEVTNMKESIIKEIEQKLLRYLDNAQMEILHKTLTQCLDNVDISIKNENFEEILKSLVHLKKLRAVLLERLNTINQHLKC